MPWDTRLREAAYISPSGIRTLFDYENVRKTVEKKTTGFDFPDADGTLVQDLGHTGRRYPLRIFFGARIMTSKPTHSKPHYWSGAQVH